MFTKAKAVILYYLQNKSMFYETTLFTADSLVHIRTKFYTHLERKINCNEYTG